MTPSTPVPGGGGLVSDELLEKAVTVAWVQPTPERRHRMAVGIAAVAPDLVRAERDRVRRECADELRADLDGHTGSGWDLSERMYARANRWTDASS